MKKRILHWLLVMGMVAGMMPPNLETTLASESDTVYEPAEALAVENSEAVLDSSWEQFELQEAYTETLATVDFDGSGNYNDPYLIKDGTDLNLLGSYVNSGITFSGDHFLVTDDATNLYLNTPIGKYAASSGGTTLSDKPFLGVFDGNYKDIYLSNSFSNENIDDLGLFGYVGTTGVVKNVNVASGTNSFSLRSDVVGVVNTLNYYVGGIAAYNKGAIINCTNSASATSVAISSKKTSPYYSSGGVEKEAYSYYNTTTYVGGIVGKNEGLILNCANHGNVTSRSFVLYGYNNNDTSISAYASSNTATAYAGGLVGYNTGVIYNSFNTGTVFSESSIASKVEEDSSTGVYSAEGLPFNYLNNTGNTGQAKSFSFSGGVAGYSSVNLIENCYSTSYLTTNTITATSTGGSQPYNGITYDESTTYTNATTHGVETQGKYKDSFWLSTTVDTTNTADSFGTGGYIGDRGYSLVHTLDTWVDNNQSKTFQSGTTVPTGSVGDYLYKGTYAGTTDVETYTGSTIIGNGCYDLQQWTETVAYNPTFSYRINTNTTLYGAAATTTNGTSTYGIVEVTPKDIPTYLGATEKVTVKITPDTSTVGGISAQYKVTGVTVSRAYNTINEDFDVEVYYVNENEYYFMWESNGADIDGSVLVTVDFEQVAAECSGNHEGWVGINSFEELKNMEPDTDYFLQPSLNSSGVRLETIIAVTSTVTVPSGVTLCLNGCTLNHTGSGDLFSVNGGSFVIDDHDAEQLIDGKLVTQGGIIKGADTAVSVSGNGTFTLIKGNLIENTTAVEVDSGTFTQQGGTIQSNDTGVLVDGQGTFIMLDGTIQGNTSYGVKVLGEFTMRDGKIVGGSDLAGNAVYVTGATAAGGGSVISAGTFNMQGSSAAISTTSTTASAVYLDSASKEFNINAGAIIGGVNAYTLVNFSGGDVDTLTMNSTNGKLYLSGTAKIGSSANPGLILTSQSTPVTISENGLYDAASVYLKSYSKDMQGKPIFVTDSNTVSLEGYKNKLIHGEVTDLFYRSSENAIYVSTADVTMDDFTIYFPESYSNSDAESLLQTPDAKGEYHLVAAFSDANTVTALLNESNSGKTAVIFEYEKVITNTDGTTYPEKTVTYKPDDVGVYTMYFTLADDKYYNDAVYDENDTKNTALYLGTLTITKKIFTLGVVNSSGSSTGNFFVNFDTYLENTNFNAERKVTYDGTRHEPPVVATSEPISGAGITYQEGVHYKLTYGPNNTNVTSTGEAYVEIDCIGNYELQGGPVRLTFNIERSGTTLDITNYDGKSFDDEVFQYSYGSLLTINVKPTMYQTNGTIPSGQETNYYIEVYHKETGKRLLNSGDWTYADSVYTATYNTAERGLNIGENDLIVKFVSMYTTEESMANEEKTITVELTQADLTAIVPTTSREYNGSAVYQVNNLEIHWKDSLDPTTVKYVNASDQVYASVEGYVESADVGSYYLFISNDEDNIKLTGEHAEYYNLPYESIVTQNNKVSITTKSLSGIDKNITIEVIQGVGTYGTPEITYSVNNETVVIDGVLTYTDTVYDSYDSIVSYLKELPVNGVLTVPYSFVPTNAGNFDVSSFTGKITFFVVDIKFGGFTEAIKIPTNPIYGNVDNFVYDPSKFEVQVGAGNTAGAYYLTVTDTLGASMVDLAMLKVGTYNYKVTFTSYDNIYKDVEVTSGSFYVNPRPVEFTWETLTFTYNNLVQIPVAEITNVVWLDDVAIVVTGGQKNTGIYTAQMSLTGSNKANYTMEQTTANFSIEAAITQGIVNLVISDTNNDGELSATDVLTADLSGIYPSGGSVFYHWYRDGILTNSTWPNYTLTTGDDNAEIYCIVSFSGNTTGSITSTALTVGSKLFDGTIEISHANGELTATVTDATTSDYTIYWTGVNTAATGTSYTMAYADYDNTVTATVIANDTSSYTGSFTNTIEVPSSKPSAVAIVLTPGDEMVKVEWTTPFHGGTELKDYELSVRNSEGEHIAGSPFTLDKELVSYNVKELTNNETYTFMLTASNAAGSVYSEELEAIPGTTETDTEGNVTTTTTTTVTYDDENGVEVTETTTTESNASTGEVTTTVVKESESEDGVIYKETVSQTVDAEGEVLAFSQDYSYLSDSLEIEASIQEGDGVSTGKLVATTDLSDKVALPFDLVQNLADRNASSLTMNTPNASMTFDTAAVQAMAAYGDAFGEGVVEIVAAYSSVNLLHTSVRERLQSAFIMNLYVTVDGKEVSDFGEGTVSINIPYEKTDLSKYITVYHVADNGMMTTMLDASYQNSNKTVTFTATHFSYYAVTEDDAIFNDISTSDWYYNAVVWAVDNGISGGTTATTFSPDKDSTRSEVVTLLWNAMGKPVIDVYNPFVDVAAYDYFYDSVRWAYNRGITAGVTPTEFYPYLECNRAQIVTFLWIASGRPVVDEELYFSDVPVGEWYEAPVRWAVSEGITSGTSPTTFSPIDICSRAEVVAFLYNCFAY